MIEAGPGWHHRLLQVDGAVNVTLHSIILRNGEAPGSGGGIYNSLAKLTLFDTHLFSNTAASGAAGLDNENGSVTLTNSFVQANQGTSIGGILNAGAMTLNNTAVISNSSSGGYGGIYSSGTLTLTSSTVESNTATDIGGINVSAGRLVMTGGAVRYNSGGNGLGALSVGLGATAGLTGVDVSHNAAAPFTIGIEQAYNSNLTVSGSTINSNSGTGISSFSALTVTNSTISGNAGGVYLFHATTLISNSTISGNAHTGDGGGLQLVGGALRLSNSKVTGNSATLDGGGIYAASSAAVTVITSTIASNTSSLNSGGIYMGGNLSLLSSAVYSNTAANGYGGGLDVVGTSNVVTVTNSTISGNRATNSGGGIYAAGGVHLNNATVTNNVADSDHDGTGDGGGLDGFVQIIAQNSLIAGNQDASPGAEAPDCGLPLRSTGYNLIQDTTGCGLSGEINITGTDPLIGPLQNNGGPTFSQALLAGSPAIDAGDPAGCTDNAGTPLTTDQRGQPRLQGTACDIGAFESAFIILKVYLPVARR